MSTLPMMTVSGIRGIVGDSLTPDLMSTIAFIQTKIAGGGTIVVGRDTRPTGAMLAEAIIKGIHAAGGQAIDIGIAATPTTCVAVKALGARGGVIITASHNPNPYNGYKMVHRDGRLCNGEECEAVYREYHSKPEAALNLIAQASPRADQTVDAAPLHIDRILANLDVELIEQAKLSIAVDATNGAAGAILPQLLKKLGVSWKGVHCALDGNFVHNPEPRPEHLTDLSALLASGDFHGGFGFDPDADRLITMGEHGEPVTEELTGAFALMNILSRNATDIAVNLSTSMVIDDVARSFGVKVFRSKIGEANVVACMQKNGCEAGAEGNGGVIYPAISTVRDGLAGIAIILELMARTKSTIMQLASHWPSYTIVKDKIPVAGVDPWSLLDLLAQHYASETIDRQDGLKVIYHDGWVHVRPSNTEPIIRIIAESRSEKAAQELIAGMRAAIKI